MRARRRCACGSGVSMHVCMRMHERTVIEDRDGEGEQSKKEKEKKEKKERGKKDCSLVQRQEINRKR